jgi:hypothetical protein
MAWTIETLFLHLSRVIEDLDKRLSGAIYAVERSAIAESKAQKEAVEKSETANTQRFASINEIRGAMQDQAAKFVDRKEVEQQFGALGKEISVLNARLGAMEATRAGMREHSGDSRANWNMVFAVIAAIGIVFGAVMAFRK